MVMVTAIIITVVFSLVLLVLIRGRKWKDGIDRVIDNAFQDAEMKDR